RNLAGFGALAQYIFGNKSLLSVGNDTSLSRMEEEDLEVNTDIYSKVIVTVIYMALFAVGFLGNSITLYTLLTKKTLQNLQNTVHYHLASLAVSDLLILVLSMPIELYNFIWFHHPWVFGDAVCRGYYFLRDSCSYATALNIASLSVERYMAICHPFKAKSIMSRSRTKKLISAMWIASFSLAIPMLFIMGQITRNGEKICTTIVSAVTMKTVMQVGGGEFS
ncbi:Neurotensin receptor type 1, partial [Goodea atripinnis]